MTQKREPTRRTLREPTAQYVVGTQGRPVAVLLTLEEYSHHLDLLDDEADSQNARLTARLAQASKRPARKQRVPFRDYVRQREAARGQVQG